MRKAPVRYAVTVALAALTAAGHLWLHGWSRTLPAEERYRILCDAFTVPGLMLVLIAALVALSNEGSFDALGYAVRYTVRRLIPGAGLRQVSWLEAQRGTRPSRPSGQWRFRAPLPSYSDGIAQDLHLFPFSPEH